MTTTCSRHNNVMQFQDISKICQVTWLESSTFWILHNPPPKYVSSSILHQNMYSKTKKSYFSFAIHIFFMKEL